MAFVTQPPLSFMRPLAALLLLALGLAACAGPRLAPKTAETYAGSRCPPLSPCAPRTASPLRQYFDASHRRYYYYDPATYRYYWEDGAPKT